MKQLNSERRRTTINSIMKRAAFRLGFEDYRKGIWRADEKCATDTRGSTWTYERGRLFAAALPDATWEAVKQGNVISKAARAAYLKLQKERVIL